MLIIKYTPKGSRLSDAGAEPWARLKAQEYLKLEGNSNLTISIANGDVFDCFRLLVIEGILKYDEIELHADGLIYTMNKYASLPIWPPSMGEYHLKVLMKILTSQSNINRMDAVRKKRSKNK
jgi:hypothetical protein